MIQENATYFEGLDEGSRIGKHYVLEARLGTGGFGEVWQAVDTRTDARIALKLVPEVVVARGGWHESFLLRHIDVPGVVKLLDEGRDLRVGAAYFVMELASGEPFPASATPMAWQTLLPRAIALARTLGRLHNQAVVHQDLKPDNVLVDGDQVTVLDFGLSRQLLDAQSKGISGTLGYIAPEQLRRKPTSPRTDIYALGVMCYEALCGELPRQGETLRQHLRALLTREVKPLSKRGVELPEELDVLVASMLAVDAEGRPASMAEVARAMSAMLPEGDDVSGEIQQRVEGVRLLEVGFGSQLDALDVGEPWALRVTALHQEDDTLALLALLGQARPTWRLARVPYGQAPFESLRRMCGMDESRCDGLDLVGLREEIIEALEAMMQDTCVISEQAGVDGWSWRLLCEIQGRQIQLVQDRSVPLARLAERELMELFSGIELWLELRSRAARALYAQTGGELFKVWRTLNVWRRLGLIGELEQQGKFILDEAKCLRIEAGEQGAWEGGGQIEVEALEDPVCLHLLTWIMISKGLASVDHCVAHMGQPRWVIEAWIEELEALGLVTRSGAGSLWTEALYSPLDVWSGEQLRASHLAIAQALARWEPRRLTHLLLAGEHDQVLAEAMDVACALDDIGRVNDAFEVLDDACGLAARRALDDAMRRLTGVWARLAMLSENLDHLDHFLSRTSTYEVDARVLELVTLIRAQMRGADDAFELDYLMHHISEPMSEPWLELCRLQMGYRACRGKPEQGEAFLREHEAWFRAQEPAIACVYDSWRAMLLSQRGDFIASAEQHEEVMQRRERLGRHFDMASSAYSATIMWFNALEYERARYCLARLEPYLAHWQGGFILRLRQFERTLDARTGGVLELEPEIVQVANHVGQSHFDALTYATEASIAWRLDATHEASRYARRLERAWRNFGWQPGELLGLAMVAHVEGQVERDVDTLVNQIQGVEWPRIVVQICGLLYRVVGAEHKRTLHQIVRQRLEEIPREVYGKRLELLSIDEACVLMGLDA